MPPLSCVNLQLTFGTGIAEHRAFISTARFHNLGGSFHSSLNVPSKSCLDSRLLRRGAEASFHFQRFVPFYRDIFKIKKMFQSAH